MAKPEDKEIQIAEFNLGDFQIAASARVKSLIAASEDEDEARYEEQQRKELEDVEQSPEDTEKFNKIINNIKREDLIRERHERSLRRKEIGLDPYAADEPSEEFEIIPQEAADEIIDQVEAPKNIPTEKPTIGRPKGSMGEGAQGAETSGSRQVPWAEDTLVNLRSMLLTRDELLKDYGFSDKEMVRIFEQKPENFLRDIVFKNFDKINIALKEKSSPELERSQVSKMSSDQIEDLLYKQLGKAADRFLPEDLSPEWWRFLHDEVPVATDAQKDKLSKLMAEASKGKFKADLLRIQIDEKLGRPDTGIDRKVESNRLSQFLSEDLESKFREGLNGVENHFIEKKTGEDLREYLEKYDKLTDADIYVMTRYYQTMLDHYSGVDDKLKGVIDDINSGDFDKSDPTPDIKTPDILEQGEAVGKESEILDQMIGKNRPGGARDSFDTLESRPAVNFDKMERKPKVVPKKRWDSLAHDFGPTGNNLEQIKKRNRSNEE